MEKIVNWNEKVWVVMFSRDQNAVHVETLQNTVEVSMRQIKEGMKNDYIMVAAFDNQKHADKFATGFLSLWRSGAYKKAM